MFKKISLIAFTAVLFASCDIGSTGSSSCPAVVGVPALAVTGPTEAVVDVPILLEVSYKTKKNCGDFYSFYKNEDLQPMVDIVTVNTTYDACSCDEVESTQKSNYTFKKSIPGTYLIKFKKTNETFVEHTVTVE